MIDMNVVLISIAIAGSIWCGEEIIKGSKAAVHGAKHAVHYIIHLHDKKDKD